MTRFGIIRHAPTLWNEQKRIQGQADSPLSDRGNSMATAWGNQLSEWNWDRLLCSDMARVQKTAALVNISLDLPLTTDSRLREQDWGAWTGMTLAEVKSLDQNLLRIQEQKGWDFRPPGGESRREILKRSLEALKDAHTTWKDEKILVICHEGVIKCLLYHLLGRDFLPDQPQVIQPYNLHLLAMENHSLALAAMNQYALMLLSSEDGTG